MAERADEPPHQATDALGAQSAAPFIYFDGVAAIGERNGMLQIELAANLLIPLADGTVRTDARYTAHIRCSPAAALELRNAIDKALLLAAKTEGQAN